MDEFNIKSLLEKFREFLEEGCYTQAVDKSIKHVGSGAQKKSMIQVKTTQLCDDAVSTPQEQAARQKEIERKKAETKKKQATRARQRRKEIEKTKQSAVRPDKTSS